MALYKMFGKITVKSYSIDQRHILGQGAFGVVLKGSDAKKNIVAAKRIDGNVHPKILSLDFARFLHLDHPNIMKILDTERNGDIVWMLMPFCEFGDLNHFYRTREVPYETNVNIMKQITAGINYLHSQDIVHRDIKPGNILVASEDPLVLQLADFDVCKCLDPEVETSLMTSNVRTLAFKAPEFFQRTSPGQIEYHRNVDIYAAGLTFLAILQADKGKKMLIPHIETPMEDSEIHAPSIGQLISERIKYKVPELRIVKIEAQRHLKRLISRMTCINSEERLTAENTIFILNNLETAVDLKFEVQKFNLVCRTHVQIPGLLAADVNKEKQILARVQVNDKIFIRVFDRFGIKDVISAMSSLTGDDCACIIAHPSDPDFVLEACASRGLILNYNIHTGESCIVHSGSSTFKMCHGPPGCILIQDFFRINPSVLKLKWEEWQLNVEKVYEKCGMVRNLCYAEYFDMLVIISQNREIKAVKLGNNNPTWKLSREVDGHMIKPDALTTDTKGNVYIGDGANNRILKINGFTGKVASILLLGKENNRNNIRFLFWSDTEPNLTLIRGDRISTYISKSD